MTANKENLRALVTNIQGFSTEDGPGIRSTVFFKGCPLKCPWCHNPEGLLTKEELIFQAEKCIGCEECLKVCERGAPVPGTPGFEDCVSCFKCAEACPSKARSKMGEWYTVERLVEEVLRDRVYYETSGGGVTASGGEAMMWWEFVAEVFKRLQAEKIHAALDTSGVIGGERLAAVLKHTDLALVDLKIMDPEKHKNLIGVELPPILHHIREIAENKKPIIIRTPVVPGYTDDTDNLKKIAEFAKSLPTFESIDLLPYHRMGEAKYRQLGKTYSMEGVPQPSSEDMDRVIEVFKKAGVKAAVPGRE